MLGGVPDSNKEEPVNPRNPSLQTNNLLRKIDEQQRIIWKSTSFAIEMENSGIDVAAATKNLITLYEQMEAEKEVTYGIWAENYEKHMSVMGYQAPRLGVETVDSVYLGDRENALVLDVPCGTGLVADGLQKLGFKNFHGIDGSEQMLKIAESKGLYQRLTCWILTSDKPLLIETGNQQNLSQLI
ncbi:hypothetical protein scyTo_0014216 [Scyliorhinus torazame]|uniref:Methyltransferase domain-containing protein n=1 Tax=Scyliorhinus torazame TaxID=75743 RepID=A0A401NIM9_SCYTO|nr:hypothetical protein [Scyliorhinus torazame]